MKRRHSSTSLEVLESRIAPAEIFIGATSFSVDTVKNTEYKDTSTGEFHPFHFTDTSASGDAISVAVDSAATNNTFYLRLGKGDDVQAFTLGGGYLPFITVTAGNVVAFFTDYNFNGDYDAGELTGLALGKNANVVVAGFVSGDVVTNLDEHATKDLSDDTLDMSGLVSAKQGISSLGVTGGSILGKVLSGGDIKRLTVQSGNVDAVLAGSAANGASFDFFPDKTFPDNTVQMQPGGGGAVSFATVAGVKGASITNAQIKSITDRLEAGAGGAGAVGGKVSNIQITNDTDGFSLLAGDGGAADAGAGKLKGGKGGDISKVFISGVVDATPNSANAVVIGAGDGGAGLSTSNGGKGGIASSIYVGFELNAGKIVNSGDLLADTVNIFGGDGGDGKVGGAGGAAKTIRVRVQTPDVNGDEVSVIAGDGGDNLAPQGGRGGVGGAVNNIDLRNQVLTFDSDIFVGGGNGGHTVGDSAGAAGGSITNATVLGFDMQLVAGSGSDGKTGGRGADVSNVTIIQNDTVLAHNVLLNAGKGGNASGGNAGNGGRVQGIRSLTSDISAFIINSGLEGDGGTSFGGKGGKGGSVSGLTLADADTANSIAGVFNIRAGHGGAGNKGGGGGGGISKTNISSLNANLILAGGDGGSATDNGRGGAGGSITTVQLTADGVVAGVDVFGTLTSGSGGDGKGGNGSGGAGGTIRLANVNVDGDGKVIAGSGGSGQTAGGGLKGSAAGSGGSILTTGVFAKNGSGVLQAGNAGVDGALPGVGGNIVGNATGNINSLSSALSGLRAATSVTIQAGNGSHGGKGGKIRGLAYGSTADSLTPTPSGDILVKGGDGSGEGSRAGAGGSVSNVFGAVGSGAGTTTAILGGNGGSAPNAAAAGGSVSSILLSLGGGQGVTLTLQAGDGGTTSAGKKGGNGGNVTGVGVTSIDPFTNFRSVAAGNGGDALAGHGGKGGNVTQIAVQDHDIGVRTGQVFGFTTMGGIFVGTGGASAPGSEPGANGSVSQISANSVASIVAGRTLQPQLVKNVSNVFLNEDNLLLARNDAFVPNGPFKLTFGSDTTALIPGNATKQQVEAKLNAINSIQMAGGVNVSYGIGLVGNSPSYVITWKLTGDQVPLTGIEQDAVDVSEFVKGAFTTPAVTEIIPGQVTLNVDELISGQRDLTVLETIPGDRLFLATEITAGDIILGTNESERLTLTPLQAFPKSEFTLSFGGISTPRLPQNATAAQVDAALEALATIAATNVSGDPSGAVVVSTGGTLAFTVTFTNPGPQALISGDFLFPESQRLDLGNLATFPNSQFTLSFNGESTAPIVIGNLNPAQLATQIETALDGLASIQNTATPPGGVGSVKVIAGSTGIFNIMFDTTLPDNDPNDHNNGDQPAIVATGELLETQQVHFGSLPSDPDATYTLNFEADTTAALPVAQLSASQIQNALNALPSVQASGPGNSGAVTVTDAGNGDFNILFNSPGDKTSITGIGLEHESQSLDLDGLVTVPSGDFLLTFNGETTASRLPAGASAQEIQDALNSLQTIKDTDSVNHTGSVAVTATSTPGVFNIKFSVIGDEPSIMSAGFIHEVQNVDVYSTGDFQVTFGNDTTNTLPATATAADVDAALEALPSIMALGGPAGDKVEVVANPTNSPNSSYNIIFHGDGDLNSIVGTQFEPMTVTTKTNGDLINHEQQSVSYLVKSELEPQNYGVANLVGAIADINEIDASVFHYSKPGVFDSPGHLQVFSDGGFQLGFIPIDGIVMAQVLNQQTLNFTPEAKLTGPTGAVFFDNDNII